MILQSYEKEGPMVTKPVKFSVAAVIRDEDGRFLAVRRPPDDDRLPNVWGLPAVTLIDGELPESAVSRIGREKLGVGLRPKRFLGVQSADRGDYELILMDIEARIVEGEPDVHLATTSATRYVDQRWTADLELLVDAARRGSLCSRIFLESNQVPY